MKKTIAVICLVAMIPATNSLARDVDGQALAEEYKAEVEKHIEVVAAINEMYARDQYAREVLIRYFDTDGLTTEERITFEDGIGPIVNGIDEENEARLTGILESYSWEDLALIDEALFKKAHTLAQHGSLELQKQTLDQIKPLIDRGLVGSYPYIKMYDRIAETEGRPQRYGTQSSCIDGVLVPYEYEGTKEELNERRAEMELEPIDDYIERLNEFYSGCGDT